METLALLLPLRCSGLHRIVNLKKHPPMPRNGRTTQPSHEVSPRMSIPADASLLLAELERRREEMLATLASLIDHETPSHDKPALDAMARTLASRHQVLGATVEILANDRGGDHVRAVHGIPHPNQPDSLESPPGLILCHYDTVYPIGTLAKQPFRVEDGRAFGPGTYDMKASLVLVEAAWMALHALRLRPRRPIRVLMTSDEEIGSPTSRRLIEDEARAAAYALVMEGPLPGGQLKTARKGVGNFTVTVTGKAAHAGVEPEKGVNAIVELAHQVLRITALADPAAGTTLNVGVTQGGSTVNVVPAEAVARVDVRVKSAEETRRIESAMRSLTPVLPGARIEVGGGFNRPPMERTPKVAALFERVREIGRALNLDLDEGSTGGASDGNFTAAVGTPTIDGLGVEGAGAHSVDEHLLIDSLPRRAALLALLMLEL